MINQVSSSSFLQETALKLYEAMSENPTLTFAITTILAIGVMLALNVNRNQPALITVPQPGNHKPPSDPSLVKKPVSTPPVSSPNTNTESLASQRPPSSTFSSTVTVATQQIEAEISAPPQKPLLAPLNWKNTFDSKLLAQQLIEKKLMYAEKRRNATKNVDPSHKSVPKTPRSNHFYEPAQTTSSFRPGNVQRSFIVFSNEFERLTFAAATSAKIPAAAQTKPDLSNLEEFPKLPGSSSQSETPKVYSISYASHHLVDDDLQTLFDKVDAIIAEVEPRILNPQTSFKEAQTHLKMEEHTASDADASSSETDEVPENWESRLSPTERRSFERSQATTPTEQKDLDREVSRQNTVQPIAEQGTESSNDDFDTIMRGVYNSITSDGSDMDAKHDAQLSLLDPDAQPFKPNTANLTQTQNALRMHIDQLQKDQAMQQSMHDRAQFFVNAFSNRINFLRGLISQGAVFDTSELSEVQEFYRQALNILVESRKKLDEIRSFITASRQAQTETQIKLHKTQNKR